MKKIKNNLNNIIKYFILFQPILDLLTSFSLNYLHIPITIGIIIRTLFMCFFAYIVIFFYKKREVLLYYFLILVYLILFVLGIITYKEGNNIIGEIQGLVRCFFFPIMLVSTYSIRKEIKIDYKWLIYVFCTYLLMIFIPNVLNIGFSSYEITKEGSIGFFNSANEISAIISILTPFLFAYLEQEKKKIWKFVATIIFLIVIVTVGTKTPLLSLMITLFFYIVWKGLGFYKNKNFKKMALFSIFLIILMSSTFIVLPKTAFFKNINTHLDFLDIDNVTDVLKEPMLIDHFIFSQRLTFLDNRDTLYQNSSNYEQIIGIGYYVDNKKSKLIEMDYFDVFYSHGPIGFVLYFAPYSYILLDALKKSKKEKKNLLMYMTTISVFLILILSFFTGHIITAPSVSLISIFIILILENSKKNDYENNKENYIMNINNELKTSNLGEAKMVLLKEKKDEENDIPNISIIVPIYNTSKYLKKCIESLINQSLSNIEILLINDGSTDDSEKIIKSFKDTRIKYFKHKNQGIGKTRNFGIKKAKGKYLLFVDSDDYIKRDMCEKMFFKAENENLALTVCDFYRDENGILEEINIKNFETSSIKENPKLLIDINLGPCNKLYDRQYIIDNHIKFEETLKYEDAPFVVEAILYATNIGKINECLTYYCIHGNSETTIRDKRMIEILQIVEIIRKKVIFSKMPNDYLNHLIVKIITNYTIQQRYQKKRCVRNKFIDESFLYLKKYVKDYKKNKYYENRGIIKRTIEKNKLLTKIYCDIYNVKK